MARCCVPAPSTAPRPSWPAAPSLQCVWPTGQTPGHAGVTRARGRPSAIRRCPTQTAPSHPHPAIRCWSSLRQAMLNKAVRKEATPTKNPTAQSALTLRHPLTGPSLSARRAIPCALNFQARPAGAPARATSSPARRLQHETASRLASAQLNEHSTSPNPAWTQQPVRPWRSTPAVDQTETSTKHGYSGLAECDPNPRMRHRTWPRNAGRQPAPSARRWQQASIPCVQFNTIRLRRTVLQEKKRLAYVKIGH